MFLLFRFNCSLFAISTAPLDSRLFLFSSAPRSFTRTQTLLSLSSSSRFSYYEQLLYNRTYLFFRELFCSRLFVLRYFIDLFPHCCTRHFRLNGQRIKIIYVAVVSQQYVLDTSISETFAVKQKDDASSRRIPEWTAGFYGHEDRWQWFSLITE